MRHRKFSQRLSRPLGHRRAALRNLVISLLKYQKIKTTKAKAKFAQQSAEHLISLGKQNSLQAHRQAFKILDNRIAVIELFSRIAPLFKNKSSGFTRVIHLTTRRGDGAKLVFLELTEKLPKVKPKLSKKEKALESKKAKGAQEEIPAEKAKRPTPLEPEPKEKVKPPREKARPPKQLKPKKFLGGLRKLFKKERDSL